MNFILWTATGNRKQGLGPREYAGMPARGQAEILRDGAGSSA